MATEEKQSLENHLVIERKIINLMLSHRDVIEEMLDSGFSPDFFDNDHQKIVQAIYDEYLSSGGKRLLTRDNFRSKLIALGIKGDVVPFLAVWSKCFLLSVKTDDLGYLKNKFREIYLSRKVDIYLQEYTKELKKTGYNIATQALVDNLNTALTLSETRRSVFASLEELRDEFVKEIEDTRANPGSIVKCGIDEIDDVISTGFKPQHLTLFVGDVGGYKTGTMINVALGIYEKGHSVLFIPLEMGRIDLEKRIIANKASISLEKLNKPYLLTDEEIQKIKGCEVWNESKYHAKFSILDAADRTSVTKLKLEVEKRAFTFKPAVVVIDYVANLEPDVRFGSRNDLEIGEILKSLRFLGKKYGFHIISAAQMGRAAIRALKEKGTDSASGLPDSTSIRGSHEYAADADTIFALMKVPDEPDKLKIYTVKARHGPSGHTQELQVHPAFCRIISTKSSFSQLITTEANLLSEPPKLKTVEFNSLADMDPYVPTDDEIANLGL